VVIIGEIQCFLVSKGLGGTRQRVSLLMSETVAG
jgi:hypothetical protein